QRPRERTRLPAAGRGAGVLRAEDPVGPTAPQRRAAITQPVMSNATARRARAPARQRTPVARTGRPPGAGGTADRWRWAAGVGRSRGGRGRVRTAYAGVRSG